jgi:hypothetical protein
MPHHACVVVVILAARLRRSKPALLARTDQSWHPPSAAQRDVGRVAIRCPSATIPMEPEVEEAQDA